MQSRDDLGSRIGPTIVPRVRPGGPIPDREYLERYPPAGLIGFGRDPDTGATIDGLRDVLAEVRGVCEELGVERPFACCDLEEGAGLHFPEGTRLPPALALAAAEAGCRARGEARVDWVRSAAALTGVEALEFGVELVLAPVVDVNTRADNPIISVRSFGNDTADVVRRAGAYMEGLRLAGAGACLKHFPGHGDTELDSHLELPRVERDLDGLRRIELAPYGPLLAVDPPPETVMVGHLDVPALTGEEGLASSLSHRVIHDELCGRLGFGGVVLSDGIDMGALALEERIHSRAIFAGCHGLLCPADPRAAAVEILEGAEDPDLDGRASWMHIEMAGRRMRGLRDSLRVDREERRGALERHPGLHPAARMRSSRAEREAFATELALAGTTPLAGGWHLARGAPFEFAAMPSLDEEARLLLAEVVGPGSSQGAGSLVLAAGATIASGRGRAGLDPVQEAALVARVGDARRAGRPVGLFWFASPELLPPALAADEQLSCLCAYAPAPPAVRAAARFLRGEGQALGSLPLRTG